jgi:CTP:molybdopterin cytidylyltransferase MocA
LSGVTQVFPLILAAGESTRMGRPKPLLDFGGRTCLDLVLAACREGGAGKPIVVLGHEQAQIRARVNLGGATVVVNVDYQQGRTTSLKAGLRVLPTDAEAFLLYPVDCPLITGGIVRSVMDGWRASKRSIVIPSHAMRRGHPVLFASALKEEFLALGDDESARTVVNADAARISYVDAPEECLVDMDTPEEYERCRVRMKL